MIGSYQNSTPSGGHQMAWSIFMLWVREIISTMRISVLVSLHFIQPERLRSSSDWQGFLNDVASFPGIKDFVPSPSIDGYEPFAQLIEKANTWLKDQPDLRVTGMQSLMVQKDNGRYSSQIIWWRHDHIESTGDTWFPSQNTSDGEPWCFLCC